ncbi:hypothetical protein [Pseudonocardia alni]|uniref:hypothetical protein n=1 Tax=Pseudonocardia alni TaxID=33907 RepID=UPI0034105B5A
MTNSLMSEVLENMRAERAAEATRTRVDGAVTALHGVPAAAEQIVDRLVSELHRVRTADLEKLGTEWRDRENERALAEANAAADRLAEAAAGHIRTVAEFTTAQAGPVDPNVALLAEIRQGKAWDRLRTQLDAGVDALTLIGRARDAADHDALTALRAEYSAYAVGAKRVVVDPAVVDNHLDEAVLATAPKDERARLRVERELASGAEGADRAVASMRRQVGTLGNFRQNGQALNMAVRMQYVRDNATVVGGPAPASD